MRQLSVEVKSTIFQKSVQLTGYAENMNVIGRTKRAVSEVYEELKWRAKEEEFHIKSKKQKQWYKIGQQEK